MLKNKNILFFCPSFFGYELKIKDKMEEMGATVDFYDERSISKSYEKALLKINPDLFTKKSESYYLGILDKIKNNSYDVVLFVKAEMVPVSILKKLREIFNTASFHLYFYDSVKNVKGVEKKLDYFDSIYSFDRNDCNIYKFNFRPLFYLDEYRLDIENEKNYKYDLCFIGTIHSDRYKIIQEIKKICDSNGLKLYLYPFLQSKFIYYFYKLIKKEFRNTRIKDFRFDKISSHEISKIVADTKVILDIQHPNQTGLTMRTIEMVGMNKKMVTTNQDIKNYDFFCNENISVIDRTNINLDLEIFKRKYKKLEDQIYNYYSIEQWILDVLGENNEQ